MANYQTLGAFSADIMKLAKTLGSDGANQIVKVMGDEAQKLAESAASKDLGGDPKFSGWAPMLDTKLKPVDPGIILMTPTSKSAGPWTVAEAGRNQAAGPVMVGPKLTKTGKVSKAKKKRWNGRTAGKGTASDAVAAINKELPKIAETELAKVVAKFFQ